MSFLKEFRGDFAFDQMMVVFKLRIFELKGENAGKIELHYDKIPQLAFTCSMSKIKTPEQCVKSVQSRSGVVLINFEQIFPTVLMFPFLTLKK